MKNTDSFIYPTHTHTHPHTQRQRQNQYTLYSYMTQQIVGCVGSVLKKPKSTGYCTSKIVYDDFERGLFTESEMTTLPFTLCIWRNFSVIGDIRTKNKIEPGSPLGISSHWFSRIQKIEPGSPLRIYSHWFRSNSDSFRSSKS